MAATIIPSAAVTTAGQRSITGYIVESDNIGGTAIDYEDIKDSAGAQAARIVYEKRMEKISLSLIVTTGTPATDFPEGAMCTVTGLTDYFVESAVIAKTKGAQRVDVELTKIDNL